MSFAIRLFAAFLLSVLTFWGCSNNNGEVKHEEHSESIHSNMVNISDASIKEIGLTTEKVIYRQFNVGMKIPATVITNQDKEAQVGSLIQGRVNKVQVKIGDYVKAGQVLMFVEGLEIGELKAHYLTAKANLEYQKANYERLETLIEQKIGSQKSYLESKAEYQKALAEFDAEDKRIHSIGLNDEDLLRDNIKTDEHIAGTLPVKSPIDGIVVERNVVIGQLVDGTTTAFRIINTGSVWIDGHVYEKDINNISVNTACYFKTASLEERFSGKIIYVGQTIDEKSRTLVVRAEFNNSNGRLKPQMFGELELLSDVNSKAVLVPAESIIKIDNADYVFVQKGNNSFESRAVVLGAKQNELIQIKEGLRENEVIVVKGTFSLKSELMKSELGGDEH